MCLSASEPLAVETSLCLVFTLFSYLPSSLCVEEHEVSLGGSPAHKDGQALEVAEPNLAASETLFNVRCP